MMATASKVIEIMGVEVDALTAPEVIVRLRKGLDAGRRQYVVTVNSEMIMRAQRDEEFKEIINQATLKVPDTISTVWAAKYLHAPLRGPLKTPRAGLQALRTLSQIVLQPRRLKSVIPGTVPGSDLVLDVAGMCEEFGHRLYLLGAADGVAEAAAAKLQESFPHLKVAGAAPGSAQERDDDFVRGEIELAETAVILVAYGHPKQERWIARNLPKLPAPVLAIGVGGTFDYLAGGTAIGAPRAAKAPPGFIRRRGLEWLWRLFTQPWRWRRILTAFPLFVGLVVRSKRRRNR